MPTVLIVDGYSSGRFLAPAFRRQGIQVVHIHSIGAPPKANYINTFYPQNFDLDLKGAPESLAAIPLLRGLNLIAVLPGADSGVLYADFLGAHLKPHLPNLPINGIEPARKDKFLMAEALKQRGIDVILQERVRNVEAALEWIQANKLFQSPSGLVVIKPLKSASGEGVSFCRTEKDVRDAFDKLLNHRDEFGQMNSSLLVQEFLPGDEYVVNTTSRDGFHVVTDIWKYHKPFAPDVTNLVYSLDTLLPSDGDEQNLLLSYNLRILSGLGIKNGNSHNEIKIVPGRGPVLVESNNRMMGSGLPELVELATGHSQIDRTVLAFTAPEEFLKLPPRYRLQKHAAVVTFSNFETSGQLDPIAAEKLRAIPGYVKHSFNVEPGQALPVTRDLNSALGDVWIITNTAVELQNSIRLVRELESSGAFRIP